MRKETRHKRALKRKGALLRPIDLPTMCLSLSASFSVWTSSSFLPSPNHILLAARVVGANGWSQSRILISPFKHELPQSSPFSERRALVAHRGIGARGKHAQAERKADAKRAARCFWARRGAFTCERKADSERAARCFWARRGAFSWPSERNPQAPH